MAFTNNGDAVWSGMGRPSNLVPSVNVIWDTAILPSGGFRPTRASDYSATITGEINISDTIQLSGNSVVGLSGGFAGITGTVNTSDAITHDQLSAILNSGIITRNSGTLISGTVATSDILVQNKIQNLIDSGVSLKGTSNSVTFTNSGIYASGLRLPASALSGASGASGTPAGFVFSSESSALFVQTQNIDKTQDSIRSFPLQAATVETGGIQGVIAAASGGTTLFAANSNRNMLFVQNLNTGVCYLSLSGAASVVNFNMLLKAGTALDDALGGTWSTDQFLGSVSISGSGGYRVTAFQY